MTYPNKHRNFSFTLSITPALANSVDTDEKQLIRKELNKIVFWNYLLVNKFCSKNKKIVPDQTALNF